MHLLDEFDPWCYTGKLAGMGIGFGSLIFFQTVAGIASTTVCTLVWRLSSAHGGFRVTVSLQLIGF